MRTPAARAQHLGLFGLGAVLFIVFVLPRWWVLTGDIPRTLATAGRIAAGIPIALAALPVLQLLKAGLGATPRPPELALRLRAWSAMLHVVAGALIVLTAIVEIWLRLQVGAPWLFGAYGAAAAIAVLGLLALYLSFVAEQPPGLSKPAKVKKVKKIKQVDSAPDDADKKPTTKRGRRKGKPADTPAEDETVGDETVVDETVVVVERDADESTSDTATVIVTETIETAETIETVVEEASPAEATGGLRNKRPAGKTRRR